jgi:chromate reductase, NAD(P)H dehydrogenase (quinone)
MAAIMLRLAAPTIGATSSGLRGSVTFSCLWSICLTIAVKVLYLISQQTLPNSADQCTCFVGKNMKILAFAGSLRRDSANKKLAREALRVLAEHSPASVEFADLRDYPMPVYDGDREQNEGLPDEVIKLGTRIGGADALIVASPEYNGSISSVLKNAIDWISRLKPMPIGGKHLLLLSASPGGWGGVRGQWHSRVPLEAIGAHVFPQMMSLPSAGSAFDGAGRLTGAPAQQLQNLLRAFTGHVAARVELEAA